LCFEVTTYAIGPHEPIDALAEQRFFVQGLLAVRRRRSGSGNGLTVDAQLAKITHPGGRNWRRIADRLCPQVLDVRSVQTVKFQRVVHRTMPQADDWRDSEQGRTSTGAGQSPSDSAEPEVARLHGQTARKQAYLMLRQPLISGRNALLANTKTGRM